MTDNRQPIAAQQIRDDVDGSITTAFDQLSDVGARIGAHIEALDASDVAMTCSKTIDAIVRDWGLVASVDITADRNAIRLLSKDEDDARYSMTGRMELRFTDQSVVERPVVVVAAIDEDPAIGIGIVKIDTCLT
jgi:flavoprotein